MTPLNILLEILLQWFDVELDRLDHILWSEDSVKVFLSEDTVLENEIIDALSCCHSFLRDLCRVLVSDDRIECCNNTDGTAQGLQ